MRCATRLGSAMILLLGCAEPEPSVAEGSAGTASSTSSGSSSSAGSSTSGMPVGTETTAVADTSGSDESSSETTVAMTTDTGMLPPPKLCSLEAVHDGPNPTTMPDAGDGVGQIPTAIGELLLRNCGCHFTNDVVPGLYVDYKSNDAPMNTLADFHALFNGTFPQGYEMMPMYLAVEQRVVHANPLPMPPFGCGVEDGEPGQRITTADLELMTDWLAAAAPDGASFP
jgi:hypothetical protein